MVVLTSFSDRDRILDALGAGAIGYLLKDAEPEELLQGIRAAARGESPLAPKAASHLVRRHQQPESGPQLTEREQEILALIAQGAPNKVIAHRLQIAEKTVKNHVSRIFQTLDVTDRTQAALWARAQRPRRLPLTARARRLGAGMGIDATQMNFRSLYEHGFARVAACTERVAIADPQANAERVLAQARACSDEGVAVALFPELTCPATRSRTC